MGGEQEWDVVRLWEYNWSSFGKHKIARRVA